MCSINELFVFIQSIWQLMYSFSRCVFLKHMIVNFGPVTLYHLTIKLVTTLKDLFKNVSLMSGPLRAQWTCY